MIRKTFKWDYLKKSPDTSGSDPNYFFGPNYFSGFTHTSVPFFLKQEQVRA